MPNAEKEKIIDFAVQSNRIEAAYHEWMKLRYLGWGGLPGIGPVRWLRQNAEVADVFMRETGKQSPANAAVVFWEFIKESFRQSLLQLQGK